MTLTPSMNWPQSDVDVLIIGAGPAGFMLANWFNHSNVTYRIIEKRHTKLAGGQADGLKCLTLEILHSIGIGSQLESVACRSDEQCCWKADETGHIRRFNTIPDVVPGMKKPREYMLGQGQIEELLLRNIQDARGTTVDYGRSPLSITTRIDDKEFPIEVVIKKEFGEGKMNGMTDLKRRSSGFDKPHNGIICKNGVKSDCTLSPAEIIRAKYLVACDGAHSWTRKYFQVPFRGQATDSLWGVMDIIPKTNFPDIRKVSMIQSAKGNLLTIPRERKLVRMYVQLPHKRSESKTSLQEILERCQDILSPYTLSFEYCDWWSTYGIGQRLADHFSVHDRIFLAGDAVHTHSPKVGQGMNMSMQDAYNLGWKLLACLKWKANPLLLKTYETERRPVAEDLLAFDEQYAQSWSRSCAASDSGPLALMDRHTKNMMFTAGVLIQYHPSCVIAHPSTTSPSAKHLIPGMRLPSFRVLNQADAVPREIHQVLRSDGRFRILVFAGDISSPTQSARYHRLGESLSTKNSCLHRFTPSHDPLDSRIEVITIHTAARSEIELADLHQVFHPWSDHWGWDYWKVYADGEDVLGNPAEAYSQCGLLPEDNCLAVIRPDGYVGLLCAMEDVEAVNAYFEGFMPLPTP